MIVFDLACAAGHVFEAWFGSGEEYERQRARGLVACPVCDSGIVSKAVMAPAVGTKANRRTDQGTKPMALAAGAPPLPAEVKTALAALAQAQAKALEGSEHVGARFAAEARAIHTGDAPERTIHGHATREEARALADEGVPVAPLPLPVVPPDRLQ